MIEFEHTVTASAGLHARPAGALVQKAKQFGSRILISANGKECEATRLMALMAMCIKCGTTVRVTVDGADEQTCAAELKVFFEQNL